MTTTRRRPTGRFIATKEHRRFTEFANTVRRDSYIGLCYGPAGVGKTLSARRYAHWDLAERYLLAREPRPDNEAKITAALNRSRTMFYTPSTTTNLREINRDLTTLHRRSNTAIDDHVRRDQSIISGPVPDHVELLIVDEAERLTANALEHLRDRFDRATYGLILIGMPGIDKRIARYPQLYSRVGFAHHYQPLSADELTFVLARHWKHLGLTLDPDDYTDAQAIAAIARITRGNFRLLHRLFTQINRIMRINDATAITTDIIDAARSTLLIGDT